MTTVDKDIKTLTPEEIAPYAYSGPVAASALRLVTHCNALGESYYARSLRAWCVTALFGAMENVFSNTSDPVPQINAWLDKLSLFIENSAQLSDCIARSKPEEFTMRTDESHVETRTGAHYSNLFGKFSPSSFWDEATELLRTRLERNQIDPKNWNGKSVLDAGCGGGRYTVAWKKLGAASVLGYDLSPQNVADASARVSLAKLEGVTFQQGNVNQLPFTDNSFDVAFSNGVLHHTTNWEKGVHELVRVLKPGGFGWLYLIENPGGLYWGLIEIMRLIMRNENSEFAQKSLLTLGIPANRVFYMLDHVMAPINSLLTSEQIEHALEKAGAKNIKRLERGVDFDRIEKIFKNEPFASVKYGVGENRHIFTK